MVIFKYPPAIPYSMAPPEHPADIFFEKVEKHAEGLKTQDPESIDFFVHELPTLVGGDTELGKYFQEMITATRQPGYERTYRDYRHMEATIARGLVVGQARYHLETVDTSADPSTYLDAVVISVKDIAKNVKILKTVKRRVDTLK